MYPPKKRTRFISGRRSITSRGIAHPECSACERCMITPRAHRRRHAPGVMHRGPGEKGAINIDKLDRNIFSRYPISEQEAHEKAATSPGTIRKLSVTFHLRRDNYGWLGFLREANAARVGLSIKFNPTGQPSPLNFRWPLTFKSAPTTL